MSALSSNEYSSVKVLVIEDEPIMRTTIVEAFHRHDGVELEQGKPQKFRCDAVGSLNELIRSQLVRTQSYDLAVIDLRLPEGAMAGALATTVLADLRFWNQAIKIVVFTGLPGGGAELQDWLNACIRMMKMGAWDFFKKGSPTELVDRVVRTWQAENTARRLDEEARAKSISIRWEKMVEWSGRFVAFYIDREGQLRPAPSTFPNDEYLLAPTYLELLLAYEQLRQKAPHDLPDRPFVAFMSPIKGGVPA